MNEASVLGFLRALVLTAKPETVAAAGVSARAREVVEEAQRVNGAGRVVEAEGKARGRVDMFLCAAGQEQRLREWLPNVSEHGVILMHDVEAAQAMAREGLISAVLLPAGHPLALAQKRGQRG